MELLRVTDGDGDGVAAASGVSHGNGVGAGTEAENRTGGVAGGPEVGIPRRSANGEGLRLAVAQSRATGQGRLGLDGIQPHGEAVPFQGAEVGDVFKKTVVAIQVNIEQLRAVQVAVEVQEVDRQEVVLAGVDSGRAGREGQVAGPRVQELGVEVLHSFLAARPVITVLDNAMRQGQVHADVKDFCLGGGGVVSPEDAVVYCHFVQAAGGAVEKDGASVLLGGIAVKGAVGQLVLGGALRSGKGSGKDAAAVAGGLVVVKNTVYGPAGVDGALAAAEVEGTAVFLAEIAGEGAIDEAVVGLVQVEGCPVEDSAAVAAGDVVDELGVADHVLGFGIGAHQHPDGAAAAEQPCRFVIFEAAAVDAHGGEAAPQEFRAAHVDGDGAAVVAGVVAAECTPGEERPDVGANGAKDQDAAAPADRQQRAGVAFDAAVADLGANGPAAAAVHADAAAAGGVVVADRAIPDLWAAGAVIGGVDKNAAAGREAEGTVGIAFLDDKSVEGGFKISILHSDDLEGIVGAVILHADISA